MKVFSFFGPVEGKDLKNEEALLDLWYRNWKANGWEPVVLTPCDLADDRETRRLLRKFRRLPSTNKKHLDMWCYARWLALAQQGGGVMSDYDVMNYGFPPLEAGPLTIHAGLVPCLVSASAKEYQKAVGWFDAWALPFLSRWFPRKHISDMLIVRKHQNECVVKRSCLKYLLPGWEQAVAVHYSNSSMKPNGLEPRHEWIPKLRDIKL